MKPNTKCMNCNKAIHKKPSHLKRHKKHFCSRQCRAKYENWSITKELVCPCCKKSFVGQSRRNTYCSRSCANKGRKGISYNQKSYVNSSQKRLQILLEVFDFDSCMVEGCDYNITYDIHRHIPGRDGGKYEIGNMFAVCPNCHAEETRKFCTFEKINDYTLRKVK